MNTVAKILKKAIKSRGYKDSKEFAAECGIAYALFRRVLSEGHIPRDLQLVEYAEKLGLDPRATCKAGPL